MDETNEMYEILKEFLAESNEGLDGMDRDLVRLEKDPTSEELLGSIFRTVHSLKGTGGVLGFTKITAVAHVGESLLSYLRDKSLLINPTITSALLAMGDTFREMLSSVADSGTDGDGDHAEIIARLSKLLDEHEARCRAKSAKSESQDVVTEEKSTTALLGQLLIESNQTTAAEISVALQQQETGDPRKIGNILVANGDVPKAAVADALNLQSEQRAAEISSSIRVDVGLLDKLMNLVGELVLARNQILQFTGSRNDSLFAASAQKLNMITTELQSGVMKTRMQPIGNIWNKFPRVVRDMAEESGKSVELDMAGAETELDKTIIEAIKDPMTHILRNALDHGIETPAVRKENGKPPQGTIHFRAFHEGGQVNIEISDDGQGIDTEAVKRKAIERSLVTAEQIARMSERELMGLVCLPGFSTAKKVTKISGRGVGMDVVKTNIEKIGGTIDLQSEKGKGTTLKIKIPLTLAIIPALIVTSGGNRFAIPQVSLVELVRLENGQIGKGIESIHGSLVYRLRGSLLPVVFINRELKLRSSDSAQTDPMNIVVVQADGRQFGLVVDEINDTEEIVVKPISKQLKKILCFAGATIMGDGQVALIVDVLGLARMANVVAELEDRRITDANSKAEAQAEEKENWLLFRAGANGRMAIKLSQVARLEIFPVSMIEHSGSNDVIQYRGKIMPLVYVSDVVTGTQERDQTDELQVIVHTEGGRSVGLVVDEIVDIVEQTVSVEHQHSRKHSLGVAVIQQRVTDLLDVEAFVGGTEGSGQLEILERMVCA